MFLGFTSDVIKLCELKKLALRRHTVVIRSMIRIPAKKFPVES